MAEPQIEILEADLNTLAHQSAVLEMLDAYARDPMGNGGPLAAEVRGALITGLREHPTTMILLAYAGGAPVGVAVCFLGFSTFAARRLLNIHDLAVLPDYRGQGIGSRLLAAVEQKGRELDCCKLTLEVQENNQRAQRTYESFGFTWKHYVPEAGGALFMAKSLVEGNESSGHR